MALPADIAAYHRALPAEPRAICARLARELDAALTGAERKVWHRHPVWFLAGNPIAGYALRKDGVCLLFWSGQSFDEPDLRPEGSFKAAEACYAKVGDVDVAALRRWLAKARTIQWDYANIVKRKGKLVRLRLDAPA